MKSYIFIFAVMALVSCNTTEQQQVIATPTAYVEEKPQPVVLSDKLDTIVYVALNKVSLEKDSFMFGNNSEFQNIKIQKPDFAELFRTDDGYQFHPTYAVWNSAATKEGGYLTYFSRNVKIQLMTKSYIIRDSFYVDCESCPNDGKLSVEKFVVDSGDLVIFDRNHVSKVTSNIQEAVTVLADLLQEASQSASLNTFAGIYTKDIKIIRKRQSEE